MLYMLEMGTCYCRNFYFSHVNGEARRGKWNVVLGAKSTEMRRNFELQEYYEWPASYSNVVNDIK